mmetsp:Transcript_20668/g.35502  ORF Transcript_20668/g.35502 Transcript_20668/m.35502 type:complete len:350 (-) Transcript_20668:241-1290(-)|eukprot:CAMPEP_0196651832 /NCGR_PEP_ID=MMETSP1086-20130531/977_1 /TAXON_ID=77921 /ORGANISM="Cyanoptyche  gloeocystis , Strain SAG4.97" /LENGTH=349 /DNA_ID=CAMNT_0041982067 /DNA_START=55 /DNA_END=1104 /DNA_ORIENTATION=-
MVAVAPDCESVGVATEPYEPSARVRFLLVGAGAVGALFAACLAHYRPTETEVSVVCRSDYDHVIQHGYLVEDATRHEKFVFRPSHVLRRSADYPGVADYILVGLKSFPDTDYLTLLGPAVGPSTSIVLLQNGVDIEAKPAAAFPSSEILSAAVYICSERPSTGHVLLTSSFARLKVGVYNRFGMEPIPPSQSLLRLAGLFSGCGPAVQFTAVANIQLERWIKLTGNANHNPLSVLGGGLTMTEIVHDELIDELSTKIADEVCAVGRAAGVVDMPSTSPLVPLYHQPPICHFTFKSSMLQDYEAGVPMEVEAILGNVLRTARKHNVPTPHLFAIYALMSSVNRRTAMKRR